MTTADLTAPPPSSIASTVSTLATIIARLGNEPQAELRRLRPDGSDRWRVPTFWRLYVDHIAPDQGTSDPQHEQRWAIILSGMARLPHARGQRFGEVLGKASLAERRLVRLLDADDDHVDAELRAVTSFLDSKGAKIDWGDAAKLVLYQDAEHRDQIRTTIARDYFKHLPA